MKEIELTKGYKALVDDRDYEWLSNWKWSANDDGKGNIRAMRMESAGDGKLRNVKMHRAIAERHGLDTSRYIDHRDRNSLNNQLDNLRAASHAQNNCNRKKKEGCSSKYKGVYWRTDTLKWQAYFKSNGRYFYLGCFDCEIDAANAYNDAVIKYHGEFAILNKIEEGQNV